MWGRSFTKIDRPTALLALALLGGAGCKGSGGGASNSAEATPLRVAAAADLARAFTEVGTAYEKKTGQKVVFSFGSTGLLAKQISQGAPFDVFAAANVSFVDEVVKDKSCLGDTEALYARGRIVLWSRKGAPKPARLADLADARFAKVAIANPEHAPYGQAAKQALEKAGLWETVSKKMVYGENVQQTLQFAQSGNADVAVVALSLAIVSPDGDYVAIDPELHKPLDQALVVCQGAPGAKGAREKDARGFIAFVGSDEGRGIMQRYGFLLPGEALSAASPSVP